MNFLETLEISQYTMITNNLACQLFELINKIVESQCFHYFSLHTYKIYFESHANIFLVTHYIHRFFPSLHEPLFRFTSKEDKDLIIFQIFVHQLITGSAVILLNAPPGIQRLQKDKICTFRSQSLYCQKLNIVSRSSSILT